MLTLSDIEMSILSVGVALISFCEILKLNQISRSLFYGANLLEPVDEFRTYEI